MRISFIGGGSMAEAMLSALLDKAINAPQDITVSDISEARRQHLEQQYHVTVTGSNQQAAQAGEMVILAVKPQNLVEVITELNGKLQPSQLVMSIIAGARINTLCLGLDHNRVVRVMPNTPAQIGEGMSVWTTTAEVTGEQKKGVSAVLGAMGAEIYVDDEPYLDMVTAISGSGPAYVFLFVESLVDAALEIGLPPDIVDELVLQTLLGSGRLVQKSDKSPAELRRMVTSPGGTTAEALKKLEEGGFHDLIKEAVIAAYNRAQQLGA
ncbi:MAG: pyrroline-5-carboxylate reductase [Chloroflexi bacterium]|nr:pyrroline-5-carboxylate reductase [Chloroflexota bacterium]